MPGAPIAPPGAYPPQPARGSARTRRASCPWRAPASCAGAWACPRGSCRACRRAPPFAAAAAAAGASAPTCAVATRCGGGGAAFSAPVPSSATAAMPASGRARPRRARSASGSTLSEITCAAAASSRLRKDWNAEGAARGGAASQPSAPPRPAALAASAPAWWLPPVRLDELLREPLNVGFLARAGPDRPNRTPTPIRRRRRLALLPLPLRRRRRFRPNRLGLLRRLGLLFLLLVPGGARALAACALACSAASRASSSRSRHPSVGRGVYKANDTVRLRLRAPSWAPPARRRAPSVSAEAFEPPLFWFSGARVARGTGRDQPRNPSPPRLTRHCTCLPPRLHLARACARDSL